MSVDQNELRRLEALAIYKVVDTVREPEFDDIVLIASELCKTPVALVSLVEQNRQWFKAALGFEAPETPLEQSICAYALASNELLIIPDLSADPRTASNPLVTGEPHFRFYAGAPLVVPDGIVIGTVCVIDTVARPQGLGAMQQQVLAALARQVVALLELRRISTRKDELFRRQKQISSVVRATANLSNAAQEAGGIGVFEVNLDTGESKVSAEFCRIFGLPVASSYPTHVFEDLILDDDRDYVLARGRKAGEGELRSVEYRIRIPDGAVRWIARNASFTYDEDNRAVRMPGTVRDITESKAAAARTEALLAIGDRLRDLDDVERVALEAAELMARALGATRAGIGVVDASGEGVVVQPDWHAPGTTSLEGAHHLRWYGSFVDDLKKAEIVLVSDTWLDARTRNNVAALEAIGIRALINVPVFDKGKLDLVVFVHFDEPHAWTDGEVDFVRSFGDRIESAVDRLRSDAEQDILNRELAHRLKNTLAMVQAIATQTLRPLADRGPVDVFGKRLQALSAAHDILISQNWVGASTFDAVTAALDNLGQSAQADIAGPRVFLGPKAALSLSLLLHELITNAIKYGALSVDDGRVSIRWRVEGEGEQAVFHFEWTETGGPAPQQPTTKSFGSKLIGMGLAGTGGVDLSYGSSGVSARMSAPLLRLQQQG